MAERLFLHIGTQKSGTTYLQRVLAALAPQLRKKGVLYPIRLVGKKEIYNQARSDKGLLLITADVLANDEWRAGEFRRREAKLVSLLNHIWRLNLETARTDAPVV